MPFFIADALVWNPDPELLNIGGFAIRYYSLLFVAALLLGFRQWMSMSQRLGYDEVIADKWLVWAVAAVVIGSRLGHCFFYEPAYYLTHPVEILKVWKGGLASHGATVGLLVVTWLYGRRFGIPFLDTADRMTIPVAIAATFVRLGNFMNSEIVGRVSDAPWAIQFPRYSDGGAHARHPSQLYEALLGATVWAVLFLVDRRMRDDGRRRGVMFALLLLLYFSGRFFVERFKEYQSLSASFPFTMGQLLSVPLVLTGLVFLVLSLQARFGRLSVPVDPPAKGPAGKKRRGGTKRR